MGTVELLEKSTAMISMVGGRKEIEEEKGTPESVSLTPSGSEGTPSKQLNALGLLFGKLKDMNKENLAIAL